MFDWLMLMFLILFFIAETVPDGVGFFLLVCLILGGVVLFKHEG